MGGFLLSLYAGNFRAEHYWVALRFRPDGPGGGAGAWHEDAEVDTRKARPAIAEIHIRGPFPPPQEVFGGGGGPGPTNPSQTRNPAKTPQIWRDHKVGSAKKRLPRKKSRQSVAIAGPDQLKNGDRDTNPAILSRLARAG